MEKRSNGHPVSRNCADDPALLAEVPAGQGYGGGHRPVVAPLAGVRARARARRTGGILVALQGPPRNAKEGIAAVLPAQSAAPHDALQDPQRWDSSESQNNVTGTWEVGGRARPRRSATSLCSRVHPLPLGIDSRWLWRLSAHDRRKDVVTAPGERHKRGVT